MADVREGAVEGDPVADVNVEAVLPVGLVDPVSICQGERFPLFTVTCIKHTQVKTRPQCINRTTLYCTSSADILYSKYQTSKLLAKQI